MSSDELPDLSAWRPPRAWRRITTIDVHTAGEPLRVVTGGVPEPSGASMLAKRRWMQAHADNVRRLLLAEPRGHADMYGCLLTRPTSAGADAGVLFFHNEGYSTMCGHGVIGAAAVLAEGRPEVPDGARTVRLDTPAGPVTATVTIEHGRALRVAFESVPAFVLRRDLAVQVPGIGEVSCDVAFGGAFYAFVDADTVGLSLDPSSASQIIAMGRTVTNAAGTSLTVRHPSGEADLDFLYGTIFVASPQRAGVHSRQACVFANGQLDRSPTGTGVSARLALLAARDDIGDGQTLVFESLLGTTFTGRVARRTIAGGSAAIVPEIAGTSHVTGRHEFLLDPADPFQEGFRLSAP